jgi:hypothetical protein
VFHEGPSDFETVWRANLSENARKNAGGVLFDNGIAKIPESLFPLRNRARISDSLLERYRGLETMKLLSPSRISVLFTILTIPGILLSSYLSASAWPFSGSGFGSMCSRPLTASPKPLLGEHYSPEENLESIDVDLIDHARQSIEIAMYAFTDRPIADAVINAAARGVHVWIYRDGIQVKDRGDKMRRLMSSAPGKNGLIAVEVKRNSSRNIMHLKSYLIDGRILRTGSANWSPPGEGAWCSRGERLHRDQQDNNLFLTEDPGEVGHFERLFRRIWTRGTNRPWTEDLFGRSSR